MDLHPSSGILALARASTIEWIDSQDGHLIDVHSNLQDSPLRLLRFNPHANRLASASAAGRLCLSSPSKPNPAAPVCADTKREGVLSLAFIDQARRLAVAFSNGILEIREAQTLRLERELRLRAKPIALTANPDGSRLAISYSRDALKPEDSRVDLLDLRTARYTPMQDASRLSRTWFRSLLFHPNGKLLFTGDSGLQGIASWDVGTGQQISSFAGTGRQGSGSRGIALSPDGQTLVSTFGDGALGFWDATSSTPLLQLLRQPSAEIRFSLAGDRLFINTYDAIEVFGTTVSPAHRRPVRFNAAPTSVPRGTGSPL
jgi:WD40 repeat protein